MGYNQHFSATIVGIFTGLKNESSSRNFAHKLFQKDDLSTALNEINDLLLKVNKDELKDIERLMEVRAGLIYMTYLKDAYWLSYCNRAMADQDVVLNRLLDFFINERNGIDDDGVSCDRNMRQTLKSFKSILDNDPEEDLATKYGILIIYFIRELFEANGVKSAEDALKLIEILESGIIFEDINCCWLKIKKLQFVIK